MLEKVQQSFREPRKFQTDLTVVAGDKIAKFIIHCRGHFFNFTDNSGSTKDQEALLYSEKGVTDCTAKPGKLGHSVFLCP